MVVEVGKVQYAVPDGIQVDQYDAQNSVISSVFVASTLALRNPYNIFVPARTKGSPRAVRVSLKGEALFRVW